MFSPFLSLHRDHHVFIHTHTFPNKHEIVPFGLAGSSSLQGSCLAGWLRFPGRKSDWIPTITVVVATKNDSVSTNAANVLYHFGRKRGFVDRKRQSYSLPSRGNQDRRQRYSRYDTMMIFLFIFSSTTRGLFLFVCLFR